MCDVKERMCFCEYCGEIITKQVNIILGACDKCRTFCSCCKCETTGESTYDGLCEDCEEERIEDSKFDEED